MKRVALINKMEHFDEQYDQHICGIQGFSFCGEMTRDDFLFLAKANDVVFNWDLIMNDDQLQKCIEIFKEVAADVQCVRVSDLGVLYYIEKNYPEISLQLSLDAKGRNIEELLYWQNYLGERLDRIVISNEVAKETLENFTTNLDVPIEVLGEGRLRLAYTPRKLFDSAPKSITSLESAHKNFPIIQTDLGTQMFHISKISLMGNLSNLESIGVKFLRIELPRVSADESTTRGFYNANKSDVLFEKLSNKLIKRSDTHYVGDILEVNKGHYMALMIRSQESKLCVGQELHFVTPDGKDKFGTIRWLKDSSLNDLESAECNQLVLINHVKGISIRTAVYEDVK